MEDWDTMYIYYISGTGNAHLCSVWIADELEKSGNKVIVQKIDRLKNITFPQPGERVIIGFAYPTHGFNAAPIMLKFMAGFPANLCRNIFLLNTRGGLKIYKAFLPGLSGLALIFPSLMLRIKGYRTIALRPVDMPSNWMSLHPGLKTKVIESIINRCEGIVRVFARKILSGKGTLRGLLSLPVDILIAPVAIGYYFGGRFFLSKTFVANNKCNNCGICIKECPTESIILVKNRPFWKLTCESCMKCLNHCPVKAIETTHGMAIVFIIVISVINSWLALAISGIFGFKPEIWWWKILSQLIYLAITIGASAAIYLFMHFAMELKPVKLIVKFTSLTTLPFWKRYTYLKNKKYKV